ncbi:Low-density lipoprotein receptor class A domain-containing protein 4 [Oryzias melastigma]|uniref:Low-density lipoprotein receptor class A domain-containing protein 4 n=1 Tax=Oryzias melastigma TaxID=30732 RepID=A0A834F8Z1_ORYME|nr:Low-density lipoprotein receptor class A domain-containing protein 4 [Oryzias melastigma]
MLSSRQNKRRTNKRASGWEKGGRRTNMRKHRLWIVIIIVVMTVMVVVIICLLNHYKFSTWSFIARQSQARRHEHALQQNGCLWPADSSSRRGASEVFYAPQARDRFTAPSFMQRDHFSRFQPTYPYMQHQIDLPPTISLSDGEEPPPYQGPCTLQLRDPEQQMELNRESVRAPPNRTIYDSDLIDMGGGSGPGGVGGGVGMGGGGPRPPSSKSGVSAANSSTHGRMEGPPPAYSEVMGHYPGSAFFLHQHSNNQRIGRLGGWGSGPSSRRANQKAQQYLPRLRTANQKTPSEGKRAGVVGECQTPGL